MTNIIIIGAGGHGAELNDYVGYSNQIKGFDEYKVIGFLDDNPDNYANYSFSAPLLGGIRDHAVRHDTSYLMGIANLKYRKLFVELFSEKGADFITLVHPTAYVSPSATIGKGVVIGPMANIGPNVVLGDFTLINSRSSMGHDTHLGKFNFISPNVCFSGFTSIGNENLFGINSATIPGIKVGDRNKITAGMILDKNVENDTVVFYRFKERVIAVTKEV